MIVSLKNRLSTPNDEIVFTGIKTTIFFQMNTDLQLYIEESVKKLLPLQSSPNWQAVSGGCINKTYKLSTKEHSFFIKINSTSIFKNGFLEEVKGLQFLEEKQVRIPKIITSGIYKNNAFLVLEWVEFVDESTSFWQYFAEQLANLHLQKNDQFGLGYSNFMGSLLQKNTFSNHFTTFFIKNRLQPQLKIAYEKGLVNQKHLNHFEKLYKELPNIIPCEKPCAIHGDLWSGNFISTHHQKVILIDPAVCYGHREVDMAMSLLFGGFSPVFYDTYQQIYPLQKGFERRKDIYNLYPLLIHLNLFGSSYLFDIERIVFQY